MIFGGIYALFVLMRAGEPQPLRRIAGANAADRRRAATLAPWLFIAGLNMPVSCG